MMILMDLRLFLGDSDGKFGVYLFVGMLYNKSIGVSALMDFW